jgi:hypothetical protein
MKARWIRLAAMELREFHEAATRLAWAQRERSCPALLWGEADGAYPFALVAPRRLAPGRATRWLSWGLAAAIATYRQFGLGAYLDGEAIWLHGRRIAEGRVEPLGECVVVFSSFLAQFPAKCVATPSGALEQAFRLRLEAQHGWQFDHSWPTDTETAKYAVVW